MVIKSPLIFWFTKNFSQSKVYIYIYSVVGMFYFYTRKWNPIIMIILLSCACHTHRHMHHHTLSMSWLYSLQQTSAVVFEENLWETKIQVRDSENPRYQSNCILWQYWLLCKHCFVGEKGKNVIGVDCIIRWDNK